MKNGKKYLLLLLCIPLLVTGCKKVPKLADGKEVVVEIEGKQFTAEELFDALKEDYGTTVLVSMVDKYITEQILTEDEEADALKEADSLYNTYYASYGSDWNSFLNYNGFTSDAQFRSQLETVYKQNAALESYLKTDVITEEEIQKYYDENIYGEITARHILITPEVTDDMTEAEQTEAKNKALEEAKELINQLKESNNLEEDFSNLAIEKSDDTGSAPEGGLIENFTNQSGLVEEFWDASLNLEVGKITEEPVESQFGYHIIYKVSQNEKPSLDTVRDTVLNSLCEELLSETNANYVYWAGLREKYNLTIHDSIIKEAYDSSMKNLQN